MITFEGPQCIWTNPSQKSRQGSDPHPIQAMPAFWDFLVKQPLPYLGEEEKYGTEKKEFLLRTGWQAGEHSGIEGTLRGPRDL